MGASSKDAGNCFGLRPWPAVHKEKLGHALSLNECTCCEVFHDGEIFSESQGPDHALACISSWSKAG
jgi:hypothetical protein